ncbi:MAG: hypothetical protein CMJ76_06575 [Planctomycetaceae bacterium]|nr:hypothetical protein [Planctomycetaceae bacterium]|tara:strand:- start:1105 stop:1455 length:351 start_codon:yes stop_codon:yes gene_type:complete
MAADQNEGHQQNSQQYELDPTFLNSRREAIIVFICWFVAMCWAIPYCYFNGYNVADPSQIPTTFGIPSWIVWGIGAPWVAADVFTYWLCFWFMKDDDLGVAGDEEHLSDAVEAKSE